MPRLTRDESRSITIEKLKAAALGEFARIGFAGASVDRIAEAAGFSRGAFYANYKSKQDLLLDLLHEHNAGEIAEWRSLIGSAQDMDSIYAGMAARFDVYLAQAEWGMLVVEVQLHAKRNEEFADRYRAYLDEVTKSVGAVLATMFEKAGCYPPAPINALASALRSYATGLILDLDVSRRPRKQHAASAMLVLFLRGLIALGEPDHKTASPSTANRASRRKSDKTT